FLFQAEAGIRDFHVTGVQTCALPICRPWSPTPRCCAPGTATSYRPTGGCGTRWAGPTTGRSRRSPPTGPGPTGRATGRPTRTTTRRMPHEALECGPQADRRRGAAGRRRRCRAAAGVVAVTRRERRTGPVAYMLASLPALAGLLGLPWWPRFWWL